MCSNIFGYEQDSSLGTFGETIELEEMNYILARSIIIDIPGIVQFCTDHTPVIIVETATLTDASGTVISTFTSEAEILALGLTAAETKEGARYTFFSDQLELIDKDLTIQFKATVEEEDTFFNMMTVKIAIKETSCVATL